ncbi:DUF6985 domain-containing protein [Actinobacillus lignieresii]|uniref:DUF6985 domain-containing protein n=1 Tax=Actinobacillus lignieresii TaxID=720 RepID=A0A380TX06_ACTLI|nr:hypothetical protein [Actinobacillus lignieresii]SUT92552.1 Uncharacterised protein [Actinobacillus lignieresii]VEB26306.1 Uncharacterised protein [Actinobacillus lignieresii]
MNESDLIFNYGWRKPINILFNNKQIEIELVFEAYKGENVNEKQKSAYQQFIDHQDKYSQTVKKLLADYKNKYQIVDASIDIKTLLINQNGSFGLLCDCAWDIENGIAIVLSPEEKIVIQDEFL